MRTAARRVLQQSVLYVRVGLVLVTGVATLVVGVRAHSSVQARPAAGAVQRCPVCSSDLVVMGIVEKVEEQHVLVQDWYGEVPRRMEAMRPLPPDAEIDAFNVHMTVQEVLLGTLEPKVFDFGMDYPADDVRRMIEEGDTVIAGLQYMTRRLGGSYWLVNRAVLVRRGNVWVSRRGGGDYSLEQIRQMLWEETDVRHLAKAADVIAVVEMAGTWKRDVEAERSQDSKPIWRVSAGVERLLKGVVSSDTLSFVVVGPRNATSWWDRRSLPRFDRADRDVAGWNGRWILFLKRGPVGLYPMGGANGMLKIKGETLLRNNRVEHPNTFEAVESLVAEEAGR